MPYEWTHPKALRRHGHGGDEFVEQGEQFDPTDEELAAFGDRIREVPATDSSPAVDSAAVEPPADDGASADETDPPLDPGDYSVADLRDALSDQAFTAAELDAIEAAERDGGSPRSTALDAIGAARE